MTIRRLESGPRMSQAVIHNGTVYLAGQVGNKDEDLQGQTRTILANIDRLLAESGSSKADLLSATIWLSDMRYFAAMNEVWDAWVDPANPPARACVLGALAGPEYLVEIMVVAAVSAQ